MTAISFAGALRRVLSDSGGSGSGPSGGPRNGRGGLGGATA